MSNLGELVSLAELLGEDERRVLVLLANRLLGGQERYGRLDLATDARDWRRERGQEVQDLLIYSAFAELSTMLRKRTDHEDR